eukprot:g79382.t1
MKRLDEIGLDVGYGDRNMNRACYIFKSIILYKVVMPPKKKQEEPAPAPQEPAVPVAEPAEPVAEEKKVDMFNEITAGMALMNTGGADGKKGRTKGTPTMSENTFFISGEEKKFVISFVQVDGSTAIRALGLKTTISAIHTNDLVWVVYLKDNSTFFSPSLSNIQSVLKNKLDQVAKIIPAKMA